MRPQKPKSEEETAEKHEGERSPPLPTAEEPPKEAMGSSSPHVASPEVPPKGSEPGAPDCGPTADAEVPREETETPASLGDGPQPALAMTEEVSPPSAPVAVPLAHSALSLRPVDGVFDRKLMLRIWRSKRNDVHPAVQGLSTSTRPGDKPPPDRNGRGGRGRESMREPLDRAQVFGSDMKTKGSKGAKEVQDHRLKVSEKGYRPQDATSREEEIERTVRSLLNKICPENLKIIVERLALIKLHKAEELEHVIRIIFTKALAEPHYCETYADMVFALKNRYPEFAAEQEGEKATTFTRVLLNTCQNEFENLPTSFEATEEERRTYTPEDLRLELKKRKDKMLANMKFIGNLFLRQLLAVRVIGQVVHDLVGIKDGLPEEHMIECVCELLRSIGYTLDNTPQGKMLMSQFSARLADLKRIVGPNGRGAFSKRIQFQIQDLLDLRNKGWQEKLFKEQAKPLEEIRKEAVKEAKHHSKGGPEVLFSTQTAGMRPSYIDEMKEHAKPSRAKGAEAERRQAFDQAYVKRLFQYYAEEKNGDGLEQDWLKAQPTPKEATQGLSWLLEIGFYDVQKEDVVAETVTELVLRRAVPWELLRDALQPQLEGLEDMRIDVPHADVFVHSLLSRLLLAAHRGFNPVVLKPLPALADAGDGNFVWSLLVGALQRIHKRGGSDAVRKALEISELAETLCKVRGCAASELKRHLQEDGVL